jgi:hypothetical protein
MTSVIVQFRTEPVNQNEKKPDKRPASPVTESGVNTTKRPKTEDESTCV